MWEGYFFGGVCLGSSFGWGGLLGFKEGLELSVIWLIPLLVNVGTLVIPEGNGSRAMFNVNDDNAQNELLNEALEPLPDLCHKCGKCCRSATTFHSYKVLQEKVAAGDQEAIDFLSIFKPFESSEDARLVEPEQVEQVLSVVAQRDDMNVEDVTFYYCEYVSPEGLCTIYERRPRCCQSAPANGWSAMPPGCGFEGWQFEQREKQKRMIRDLKTSAYMMEQLSPDGIHHPARPETTLADLRALVQDKIRPWKPFGAHYW